MRLDLLLHLDLLVVALLLVELRSQARQGLRVLRLLVSLSGGTLALAFVMIETVIECEIGWLERCKIMGAYRLPCSFVHRSIYSF